VLIGTYETGIDLTSKDSDLYNKITRLSSKKCCGNQQAGSCERVFSPYIFINIGSIDAGERDGKRCTL
jgi:hypothetical protein